jgi:hypothetical protein
VLDVSLFTVLARQLGIDTSTVARQLPMLVLYEKGKEAKRVANRQQDSLVPRDSFRREVGQRGPGGRCTVWGRAGASRERCLPRRWLLAG